MLTPADLSLLKDKENRSGGQSGRASLCVREQQTQKGRQSRHYCTRRPDVPMQRASQYMDWTSYKWRRKDPPNESIDEGLLRGMNVNTSWFKPTRKIRLLETRPTPDRCQDCLFPEVCLLVGCADRKWEILDCCCCPAYPRQEHGLLLYDKATPRSALTRFPLCKNSQR